MPARKRETKTERPKQRQKECMREGERKKDFVRQINKGDRVAKREEIRKGEKVGKRE